MKVFSRGWMVPALSWRVARERSSWLPLSLLLSACGSGPRDSGSAAGCTKVGDVVSCSVDALELSSTCAGSQDRFASRVHAVAFGPGAGFGQDRYPDVLFGPPEGGGALTGSLDVLTLGDGGSITLGFEGGGVLDGPGVDLVLFENPFWVGGNEAAPFAELGRVEVSADGETWRAFPCSVDAFEGCSGWRPVVAGSSRPDVDPLDPEESGGDGFDLAEVGLVEARLVRITDLAEQAGRTFDLDAAAAVHPLCP